MLPRSSSLAIAACALVGGPVLGQVVITVPDGSFEGITASVVAPPILGTVSGPIGSWNATASGILDVGTSVSSGELGPPPPHGTYALEISLPIGVGVSAGISQTLAAETFQPNSIYTLSVYLDQGTAVGLIQGTRLDLLAGGTPVASLIGDTLVTILDGVAGYQQVSLNFQTGSTPPSGNIGIGFSSSALLSIDGNVYADNFTLTVSPVPEPQEYAMLGGAGLLAFGLWRRVCRRSVTTV